MPGVGGELSHLFATHDVIGKNALGPWNFEIVPQLDGNAGIFGSQLHPARKIQALRLPCRR